MKPQQPGNIFQGANSGRSSSLKMFTIIVNLDDRRTAFPYGMSPCKNARDILFFIFLEENQ